MIYLTVTNRIYHKTEIQARTFKGGERVYSRYKEQLKKKGITSYRVSKDTGIPTATLSDWKNGRSTPKIDKLQKLAEYFNVSVNYFIE